MARERNTLHCSFCGLSQFEVRRLVAGPNVFACNECIDLMYEIIHGEDAGDGKSAGRTIGAVAITPTRKGLVLAVKETLHKRRFS